MRYSPIIADFPHLLHGSDYNPDQWLDRPSIIDDDFRLAREARMNSFSVGIFAWTALEPEEGRFEFDWLDSIMDRMAAAGMKAVLATPSGAKPSWMALKYPEICRVQPDGVRELHGSRHNHCFTSPVYREKVTLMNTRLAARYGRHPALGLWHLSNEYNGECHCALCKAAFRAWLQRKYGTLDALNQAWWTAFWSHSFTAWEQIDRIDESITGMMLDWRRFVADQTADFICNEREPLRRITPHTPVTTNFMGGYPPLDYRRLAPHLDVISWDSYPAYHARGNMPDLGAMFSFLHDLNRGLKGGQPFLLMESSPSAVNWMAVNKLLRPGIHRLKSIQAVAHGADSVQYFQWRKGRGGSEKFHGAVVDHVGHADTRVFRDVAGMGADLARLDGVVGACTPSETAILYDWESRWILDLGHGPLRPEGGESLYESGVLKHYRAFWNQGVPVDVIGSTASFESYRLIVAPMLYLLLPGVAERLTAFVRGGGTLIGTYLTGIADENDLVFEGGWPGPLRPLFGIWAEEIDYLYEDEANRLIPVAGGDFEADYRLGRVCDLIHADTAQVFATYGDDFYAGRPCLTRNAFGDGAAWYLAACPEQRFLDAFYATRVRELGLKRALETDLPEGVTAQIRTTNEQKYVFLMNFTNATQAVDTGATAFTDAFSGMPVDSPCRLPPYGVQILVSCQ